jgi:hypothetical protein
MKIIETDRLILRTWEIRDTDPYFNRRGKGRSRVAAFEPEEPAIAA